MGKYIDEYLANMVRNRLERESNKIHEETNKQVEYVKTDLITEFKQVEYVKTDLITEFKQIDKMLHDFINFKYPNMIIDDVGFFANQFCIQYKDVLGVTESHIESRVAHWIKRGWK
jgi:hypothetical protein